MDISELVKFKNEPDIYYNEHFQYVLTTHITYLKNHPDTKTIDIDPVKAIVYQSDFYGLLTHIGIESRYHWIILRLNDFCGPREFGADTLTLVVPRKETIDKIIAPFKNTGIISI